jgi:NADP-dependent 3-hydroxy acid dehydrogenase YdfG
MFVASLKEFGKIDIVVANAGIELFNKRIHFDRRRDLGHDL